LADPLIPADRLNEEDSAVGIKRDVAELGLDEQCRHSVPAERALQTMLPVRLDQLIVHLRRDCSH
jgi:hypothetical protein